jgi:hypothetical protein
MFDASVGMFPAWLFVWSWEGSPNMFWRKVISSSGKEY